MPKVALKGPLEEVDDLIRRIRRHIHEAEQEDFPSASAIEKMQGRELAAQRLRANIIDRQQRNTTRLLDAPEWIQLADKIATVIGDCDHCSKLLLPLLLPHMPDQDE
jgi:hypothetical protein